jgi:hypothetical protein
VFIGHFALGFAGKRVAPTLSLAVLFAAAQLADLLWPIFVAIGLERVRIAPGYTPVTQLDFVSSPYSHSLALLIVWGVLFGYLVAAGTRARHALALIAALVVSHWVLDYITHPPDMPLYPGGPKLGLGLWYSLPLTIAVEVPMYLAGLFLYFRATRPRDAIGRWAFGLLAATLLILYVGSIAGPPPPSVTALWTTAIAGGALILAWAWWADRHRDVR